MGRFHLTASPPASWASATVMGWLEAHREEKLVPDLGELPDDHHHEPRQREREHDVPVDGEKTSPLEGARLDERVRDLHVVVAEDERGDRVPATIRLLKPGSAEMAFYEEEDYERLVEGAAHVDERALIAVLLGGDAGLRTGEMIALEWTDIDFRRSLLHVNQSEWEGHIGTPKGGRARTVNTTSRLTAALKAHRHLKGPRVLYSDDKSTADRDALASWIRRAERRAGLSITGRLHILRHTFCSRLAIRGATTKAIQELAGHVSLTTTQRYMHLSPAAKESAIRLLELDVRGEKRGEIRESSTASEENGR